MGLDMNRLKQKQEESALSGNRWKPKKSPTQNFIRVFKFTHKVTDADVKAGLFTKDKVGKTIEDFDRSFVLQYGFTEKKRPIVATKETLAKYDALRDSSNKANNKAAEAIKPSKKFFMNIVDMSEKPRKMRRWGAPSTAYNDILAVIMNGEFGEAVLGSKGRDFIVTHDPEKSPQEQYKVQLRDKEKSVILDIGLEKKVVDFYSPEGLKELGLGAKASVKPQAEEEETEEQEEETTEESVEETTEEAPAEESTEEQAEETSEESTEETTEEASEEVSEESTEETTEEPVEEEPAEEPAPKPAKKPLPAKKPATPAKKGKK